MKKNLLNTIYIAEIVFFVLIVLGVIPRQVSLVMAVVFALYVLWASLEDGLVFFIRSIPLFLALPLTASFDNFNTWRILAVILFLKWLWSKRKSISWPKFTLEGKLLLVICAAAVLSIFVAGDKVLAIKRVIYFTNIGIVGIIIWDLVRRNKELAQKIVKNIAIPGIVVAIAGFLQLATTYLMDVYQFMHLWGEGIQCRQFGEGWCYTAVHLGNTWLAYYGDQLSLRVFSLFPDSHSFPQFVLLTLPSIFAISILKLTSDPEKYNTLKKMVHTRVSMKIVWVPVLMLIAILSGTRGIWAASVGVVILAMLLVWWFKRQKIDSPHRNLFKYLAGYLFVFFFLFSVAYPIFVSPQFLLSKGDWGLLESRIRSIIDFGETSNSQRIEIWKRSLESIQKNPVLGVGIGNFPIVLSQKLSLAKAGSSAHNIYIHIAAEIGLPALIATLWFLWFLFQQNIKRFIAERDPLLVTYFGATLLFVPWVLIYCLTDVALFDERAFLLFVTVVGLILSIKKPDTVGN